MQVVRSRACSRLGALDARRLNSVDNGMTQEQLMAASAVPEGKGECVVFVGVRREARLTNG